MARKVQEINASSMADIAFLLLIFFLVTTTMDVDSGIQRILPPIAPDDVEDTGVEVNKRNLLLVFVNASNDILVGGQRMDVSQISDKIKEFVLNPYNEEHLPSKTDTEIEGLGTFPVSDGVVSLQNDRGTSYDMYITVQNELTRAFNEVRNETAIRLFGNSFDELTEDQKTAIQKAIPLKISEAEPRNIGGA